jgi:glycosyltransferase involved in cell wall biosynthesis
MSAPDGPLRVLQVHNRQLTRGGADIEMEREAEALTARGHAVETMLVDNRQIEAIGQVRASVKAFWNREATTELRRRLQNFRPDVMHVQTPFPILSPAVFVVADRAGVPVVATSQSHRYSCVKATLFRDGRVCEDCVGRRVKYPAVIHRCYKGSVAGSATMAATMAVHSAAGTFARRVDRFVALTPFMRERLLAEGLRPEQVTVIPNSVPDPGPPLDERGGYAIYMGRLVPEKGMGTLLEAWARLEADVPLVVAGDGVMRPEVEQAAAADPRIRYVGWVDGTERHDLVARADAFLLTSEWYEGFPVVIPEAFAAGTPIIASDVGNFTDAIKPGHNGLHYRSGDPESLAAAVTTFFAMTDRSELRKNARADFERDLDLEVLIGRFENLYREVIAERRARLER